MASLASTETLADDWIDVEDMEDLALRAKPTGPTKRLDTDLYQNMNAVANNRLKQYDSPIFVANLDARRLYSHFHDSLAEEMKQDYNCNSCRAFVRRYGGLVLVDDDGALKPLLWDPDDSKTNPVFRSSIAAVSKQFQGITVTQEFKATEQTRTKMLASCRKGRFSHMYLSMPQSRVSKQTATGFGHASTKELAKMLAVVVKSYSLDTVRRATQILEQDKLPHADNHKAAARWLLDILEDDKIRRKDQSADTFARYNLGYRYAASAFAGCISQLKSGVLSKLLDAIDSNQPWVAIDRDWRQLTDPTKYLRPQVAPQAGNIATSERLFNALGITETDLQRRFLVFDDIPKDCIMWQSQSPAPAKVGLKLFANIIPKAHANTYSQPAIPPTPITFTKLFNTILPTATKMEYKLSTHNGLYFFVTGNPSTKPLMQWHFEDNENRASWYIYNKPNPVKEHGLKANEWNEVGAIIPFPHLWDGGPTTTKLPLADVTEGLKVSEQKDNDGTGAGQDKQSNERTSKWYHSKNGYRYLLILSDIVDKRRKGLDLFPSLLKGEFHGARATIEAYSNAGSKSVVQDVQSRGGYVGGIEMSRSIGKSGEGKGKHLVRVTDQKGLRSCFEILLFE